ncbi:hypothetical protein C8Q76DRAFT_804133 [Earliella scabrosa]|nr:hypothetical protein C8Q76DRAFT_804133 [Earliella scabrosa]
MHPESTSAVRVPPSMLNRSLPCALAPTPPRTPAGKQKSASAAPVILQRTRFDSLSGVKHAWDARVASHGVFSQFVLTSPNTDYVPEYPVERHIVQTFADGRWGLHEYSRWPQAHMDAMTHVACIPRGPHSPALPDVLWETLRPDVHWAEDQAVAVRGLGYIVPSTRDALLGAAKHAIHRFDALSPGRSGLRRRGYLLVLLLRQVMDRMVCLPTVASRAIAVAAHIQRLCLELAGLCTYMDVILPRLQATSDFSDQPLNVVGAFLRDAGEAQTWLRVGIPFWLLQPFRADLAVWRVVDHTPLDDSLSHQPCYPPLLHRTVAYAGVTNLTGNWLSNMVVAVSTHVAGSCLAALPLAHGWDISQSKASNIALPTMISHRLHMRPGESPPQSPSIHKKTRRGARRHPQRDVGPSSSHTAHAVAYPPRPGEGAQAHPARSFLQPAFVNLPRVWAHALRSSSPVKQTGHCALYFYPPPFLLDTVDGTSTVGCLHPHLARHDSKILRYLHNLARVRHFCRLRLFDPSVSHHPLSVAEWRTVLWGDYSQEQLEGRDQDIPDAHARRSKRRLGERNAISALFHQVAHMESYRNELTAKIGPWQVDVDSVSRNPCIRALLLWEAYELNFRTELMALDTVLVQTDDWQEIHRWEREAVVSAVWGETSSGVTVIPPLDACEAQFYWREATDARWPECKAALRAFANLLSRWPGCPDVVHDGSNADLSTLQEYDRLQTTAVSFYVRTFVNKYSRLPTAPIALPPVAQTALRDNSV